MTHHPRAAATLTAFLSALAIGVVVPDIAAADPATPATYPSASSATRAQGRFFDTCAAGTRPAERRPVVPRTAPTP